MTALLTPEMKARTLGNGRAVFVRRRSTMLD